MLDPRLLRAFVAIADTGSFTLAANRLYMTQSTVSQQLGRLEQQIGHSLIDRTARPAKVTPLGERFLGHARRILSLHEEAEAILSDRAGSAAIRIGLPDDIVTLPMTQVFAAFAAQHREVRLDVTTGLSREITRCYRGGEFDIAVVKEESASPDCRVTFPEKLAWFESAAVQGRWPDPTPLVAFPPGGLYRDAMFEQIERQQRGWYVAFTGSSLHSVLTAVEAGLGLSLLPASAAANYRIRPYTRFGAGTPLFVSLYAWEREGAIGILANKMSEGLAARAGNTRLPTGLPSYGVRRRTPTL